MRAPGDPGTSPGSAAPADDVDNTGAGPTEAQRLDGPGPKPLEEVARARGGDAGHPETTSAGEGTTTPATAATNSGSGGGLGGALPRRSVAEKEGVKEERRGRGTGTGNDDADEGPGAKSKGEEGTGEKYVKSSGLNADGGDFDVTRPGAGREADRK